jgi:hypothetical protein
MGRLPKASRSVFEFALERCGRQLAVGQDDGGDGAPDAVRATART